MTVFIVGLFGSREQREGKKTGCDGI